LVLETDEAGRPRLPQVLVNGSVPPLALLAGVEEDPDRVVHPRAGYFVDVGARASAGPRHTEVIVSAWPPMMAETLKKRSKCCSASR
jgi:hypothetical protein